MAQASSGIEIFHRERPDNRVRLTADETLQKRAARAVQLKILGSTLFVSGQKGGLQVYDLADPMAPKLVSAGNVERVESIDYYKDRLIIGGATAGFDHFGIAALPGG